MSIKVSDYGHERDAASAAEVEAMLAERTLALHALSNQIQYRHRSDGAPRLSESHTGASGCAVAPGSAYGGFERLAVPGFGN